MGKTFANQSFVRIYRERFKNLKRGTTYIHVKRWS